MLEQILATGQKFGSRSPKENNSEQRQNNFDKRHCITIHNHYLVTNKNNPTVFQNKFPEHSPFLLLDAQNMAPPQMHTH